MQNLEKIYTWLIQYGLKFIGAILILIIGFWLIKKIIKYFTKFLTKRNVDPGLISFLKSFLSIALKIAIIISVMDMVGIKMTSFIAILSAAGLAIGLAFQGSLSNIAGGVMILLFKPFKVGDFIETQGYSGTVTEILLFYTILKTVDNKVIVMPNSSVSNNTVTNFTRQKIRRIEWKFSVAYNTDYKVARDIIENVILADSRILNDPPHFIGLAEMADSSINIIVRAWTSTDDYWNVFFDINEKIYSTFNEKQINIPFPQMDVHIKK